MRHTSLRPLGLTYPIALSWFLAAWIPSAHAGWLPNGVPLCNETRSQVSPAIVPDGANGAIVVWNDLRSGNDLYAQRVDGSGVTQWSTNGVAVCTATGSQIRPIALSAPGGGAFLVWQDGRFNDFDIFAQRIDELGVSQWTFNGIPLGSTGLQERFPVATSDLSNALFPPRGLIAAWETQVSSDKVDLRVQHVDGSGGGLWISPGAGGVTLASNIGFLAGHSITTDGIGPVFGSKGAVVAWSHPNAFGGYDVYARRVDRSGVPQWSSNGVEVCGLSGNQITPEVVNVGGGNVIVIWADARTGGLDLYAQKLNSSGAVQWLANGLPVCRAPGDQFFAKLVPDGAGGVFAVWADARGGPQFKMYAQRLDGNGNPLWQVDGIPLCSAPGIQNDPAIVSDGVGGVIVAWKDLRGISIDLYAQRVDPNGNLLWPDTGVPLSKAAGDQGRPALASDGQSGAIVVWEDTRAGNLDIYANRVFASGGVVEVPAGHPTKLRLALVSSNPARGEVQLRLELPEAAYLTAEVLDVSGRRVRTLVSGSEWGAGVHLLNWDGADDSGNSPAAAGVFFIRLRAGDETRVTRIVRVR